jgi:hypothetical protein
VTLKTKFKTKYVYHPSDQIKRNEMGMANGIYGRGKGVYWVLVLKPEEVKQSHYRPGEALRVSGE